MTSFDRSLRQVRNELFHHGLERLWYWTDVERGADPLQLFNQALGWYLPTGHTGGDQGLISIPAWKVPIARQLASWSDHLGLGLGDASVTFTQVLRHEFGHALADALGLMEAMPAWWERSTWCVSDYARTNPDEDFAETFMCYLKHGGRLPDHLAMPGIARKWAYVRSCIARLRRRQDLPLSFTCSCGCEVVLQGGPGVYPCPEDDCPRSFRLGRDGGIAC